MKQPTIFLNIFILTAILSISSGCRTELDEVIGLPSEETLTASSKVAQLISQTVMNDGSGDDILDGSNFYTVKLPVTVYANDILVTVNSAGDFNTIEEIFDDQEGDINFIFPITLISNDYSEALVENEDQLEEILDHDDDENQNFKCIDFKYPLSASVFNKISEIIETIIFNNDREFYNFVNNINEYSVINIDFPITLENSINDEIIIDNLQNLENVIEESTNDCDQNYLSQEYFTQVLISQIFEVQKYKENQSNETNNYKDFVFDFFEDSSVAVTLKNDDGTNTTINGTWTVNTRADEGLDATLNFGNETPLHKLNNNWNVKKIEENRIILDTKEDQDINKDELFFIQT